MTSTPHIHASEELAAYVTGGLAAARRAEIDSHLATCEECSQELAGVMALRAEGFEPMTGPERERVTARVRAAVTDAGPGLGARWSRRLAPALGAAALVAIAVVGYVSFGGDDAGDTTSGGQVQEAAPPDLDDAAEGADTEGAERGKVTLDAAPKAQAGALEMEAGSAAGSSAENRGVVGIPVIEGRRFALASLADDLLGSRGMRDEFRTYDAGTTLFSADDPGTSATMEACARAVVDTSPYPLVPTSAAHFARDDIIVIAFVWRDEATGTPNFMLRGWRGGDCGSVSPIYRIGRL